MTYSVDLIGTFKTFVAALMGKVAALTNIDHWQARKRSDSPSMEIRGGEMSVFLDRRERRRRCPSWIFETLEKMDQCNQVAMMLASYTVKFQLPRSGENTPKDPQDLKSHFPNPFGLGSSCFNLTTQKDFLQHLSISKEFEDSCWWTRWVSHLIWVWGVTQHRDGT